MSSKEELKRDPNDSGDDNIDDDYDDDDDQNNNLLRERRTERLVTPCSDNRENPSTFNGIKFSISALGPYFADSSQPKIKAVHVLEILPNGDKAFCGKKTMSELLHFVYQNEISEPADADSSAQPRQQGELKKIRYQDFRHLENQFHNHDEPVILVRRHAILIAMNPIRAIITADRMILLVPLNSESLLHVQHNYMKGIFEDISNQDFSQDLAPTPTENTQLKAVLATITALHHESFASIAKKVESQLQNLKQALKITAEMQDTIRGLKNVVSSQMITIDAYRESLKAVYDDSDLLALMNLTKLKLNPELYRKPLQSDLLNHRDDITILVESYLVDHNAIGIRLKFLLAQIQSSEELVSFRLDMYRNDLLFVEMILLICMLSLTVGSYVTASFGMNINTGLPIRTPRTFWTIASVMTFLLVLLSLSLIFRYRLTGSISATIVKESSSFL